MLRRIISWILDISGYLVPLVQSLPPLGVWTGLMTVPLISYLILTFSSLPSSLPLALTEFFWNSTFIKEKVFITVGLLILIYSSVYLRTKGGKVLVTSGPYRITRHPQYLGIIFLTLGFTSWSYLLLTNTWGIGFLTPSMTRDIWFIQLLVYLVLALIEEQYLSKKYGESFVKYRSQVPMLFPFIRTKIKAIDIILFILIPAFLLWIFLL